MIFHWLWISGHGIVPCTGWLLQHTAHKRKCFRVGHVCAACFGVCVGFPLRCRLRRPVLPTFPFGAIRSCIRSCAVLCAIVRTCSTAVQLVYCTPRPSTCTDWIYASYCQVYLHACVCIVSFIHPRGDVLELPQRSTHEGVRDTTDQQDFRTASAKTSGRGGMQPVSDLFEAREHQPGSRRNVEPLNLVDVGAGGRRCSIHTES